MRLRKTSIAEQVLLSIWEYIAQDSPAAADRFWQRLEQRFESLRKNPYLGEAQDGYRPGLRSIVEGSYIIFYEPQPGEILIFRILHGARKWDDLL